MATLKISADYPCSIRTVARNVHSLVPYALCDAKQYGTCHPWFIEYTSTGALYDATATIYTVTIPLARYNVHECVSSCAALARMPPSTHAQTHKQYRLIIIITPFIMATPCVVGVTTVASVAFGFCDASAAVAFIICAVADATPEMLMTQPRAGIGTTMSAPDIDVDTLDVRVPPLSWSPVIESESVHVRACLFFLVGLALNTLHMHTNLLLC